MSKKNKTNIKIPSIKKVKIYSYLLIYFIFFVILVYIGFFLKRNIYDIINKQDLIVQARLSQTNKEDFSNARFEKLIREIDEVSKRLEEKKVLYRVKSLKNIFYN